MLVAARAEGKYCKLPEEAGDGKVLILVNPEAVQVIRPAPETEKAPNSGASPTWPIK